MKTIPLGKSGLEVPAIAIGCMRMNRLNKQEAARFIQTAIEYGANFFDHADIYAQGRSEEIFSEAIGMNPGIREKIFLQSKCGIVPGKRYDFSKEHILESVNGSLRRLKTDYLDSLLLHRPDALVEPEEVAEAFDTLHTEGKVRFFGVSNHTPLQIQLLQKYLHQPLIINQLQFSLAFSHMVSTGMHANMEGPEAFNRDGSVLDFCRLNGISIQPWSPFQHGFIEGCFLENPDFPSLNTAIDRLAEKYRVSNTSIALAWILRHPAKMQPVIGTMNIQRLKDCLRAVDVHLSRQEWYDLYVSAGNTLP